MSKIIKDTLHPENESGTDIYPKTSSDQVVGYGQNLEGNNYALEDETCKKPINLGTPTHVLGVDSPSSNQPINIPIGFGAGNIPKRNSTYNLENLYDATKPNELIRKSQFDKGLSEVSAPVVNITATATATQGTISSADLAILQGNKSAMIRFNNELYYFMDDEYKSGYLTYSHVGVDASVQWVKSITITISSLSWVLTKSQVGGGKIYKHILTYQCTQDITAAILYAYIIVYNSSNIELDATYLGVIINTLRGTFLSNNLANSSPEGPILCRVTSNSGPKLECSVIAIKYDSSNTNISLVQLSPFTFEFKYDTVTEV